MYYISMDKKVLEERYCGIELYDFQGNSQGGEKKERRKKDNILYYQCLV